MSVMGQKRTSRLASEISASATSRRSKDQREDSVGLVEASNSDARERWPAERAYDVPVSGGVGGAKQRERLRRLG
jgi:hypothetical protein